MIDLRAQNRKRKNFTDDFQQACTSKCFRDFAENWGLVQPKFAFNPSSKAGENVFDRFYAACRLLAAFATLAVVFHGTHFDNIETILRDGLDPGLRKVQAYGSGEYFSTDPGLSVSYCKGGLKMLVFLVAILPSRMDKPNIVVVTNNDLQLPLGTVSFSSVRYEALQRSSNSSLLMNELSVKIAKARNEAAVASAKANIIQVLIRLKCDIASENYRKNEGLFSDLDKREISMYAHQVMDEDFILYYFEGIPDPLSYSEHDDAAIESVDSLVERVNEAKCELVQARSSGKNS
jgi:Poly(ADP-ribose) polymerase catalytic domain